VKRLNHNPREAFLREFIIFTTKNKKLIWMTLLTSTTTPKINCRKRKKRMELSDENSDNKPVKKAGTVVMKFKVKEDEEAAQISDEKPSKKHRFTKEIYLHETEESQKVEETPEDRNMENTQEYEEGNYAVKQTPRSSRQRKYKAWEKPEEKNEEQLEDFDPQQEYETIKERIRERNKIKQKEYQETSNVQNAESLEASGDKYILNESKSIIEAKKSIDESKSQMINKFQDFKEKSNEFKMDMDKTINQPYHNNANRSENLRHTINVPPSNFNYESRAELQNRQELEYSYSKNQNTSMQASQIDPRPQYTFQENCDFEGRSPQQRNFDNSQMMMQQQREKNEISMLRDELRFMKSQQEKILENQNIFQTYISNEITSLKNRMNQLESDFLLSKTLSSSQMRGDMGLY
jgi:hypothetical protein